MSCSGNAENDMTISGLDQIAFVSMAITSKTYLETSATVTGLDFVVSLESSAELLELLLENN